MRAKTVLSEQKINEVLRFIPIGKDKQVTSKEIQEALGIEKFQYVQTIVRILRMRGHLILATNRGYYKSADKEECEEYVADLYQRAEEMIKVANKMSIQTRRLLNFKQ